MTEPEKQDGQTKPQLGLFDAVSIIIGIVVGVSIFKVPQLVFGNVETAWGGMGIWALGGLLSLIGALCYAELATTYPRSGGDYVYLSRAFGSWVGFLFGWAQLAVILTGSIGVMAYAFSDYAKPVFGLETPAFEQWVMKKGGVNKKGLDRAKAALEKSKKSEKKSDKKSAPKTAEEALAEQLVATKVLSRNKADGLVATHASLDRRSKIWGVWLALGAVILLSVTNLLGVVWGKAVQNVLTVLKVVGLAAIVVVGLFAGGSAALTTTQGMSGPGVGLALVFVLYAFGGWNDAAFVAAEVKNPRRNLPLALILGTLGITAVYLLVNGAYLWVLGFEGIRGSSAPAADVMKKIPGSWGANAISVLVMVSALGAVNGLIFTGSRIYASLGADHSVFAALGRWHPRFGSPAWSLLAQGAIAVLLILAVGTQTGTNVIDRMLVAVGWGAIAWGQYNGGFDTLVAATAPVFWTFFLLTGLSLFKLRELDQDIKRPFSAPLYPFVPFIFCLMCVYMLNSSINYAGKLSIPLGLVPLLLGLPLYFLSRRTTAAATSPATASTSLEASS